MALLGLGFSFGAKDEGLHKQLVLLRDDFKSFGKEIVSLQKLQTFLSALSFEKLDKLGDKIRGFSGGVNLTSNLEAQMQALGHEATKTAVKFGVAPKAMGRFRGAAVGIAHSLNISASEAGAAVQAVSYFRDATRKATPAGEAFAAMGLTTAASLARFGKSTGIDVNEFVYGLNQMGKAAGLGGEAISRLVGSAHTFGKEFGDVPGSLQKVVELRDMLIKRANLGFEPKEVERFGQSVYGLATQLQELGYDGMPIAMGLAERLNEFAESARDMTNGVATELDSLISGLAITGFKSADVFEAMKKGPLEFSTVLAQMVDKSNLSEAQIKQLTGFFASQMKGKLPEQFLESFQGLLKSTEKRGAFVKRNAELAQAATDEALQMYAKSGDRNLKAIANLASSERTAQDAYEMMKEAFHQRIRGLASLSTGEFLRQAADGYKTFGDALVYLKKSGGPMSVLVGKLGDIEKYGAAGLFPPSMIGQAEAFGTVAETLAAPLAKMRAAGIDLLSPMGALSTGLAIAAMRFTYFFGKTKDAKKALKMLGDEVLIFIKDTLPKQIKGAFQYLGDKARAFLSTAMTPEDQALREVGGKIVDALRDGLMQAWEGLKRLGMGLWKGLTGEIASVDQSDNAAVVGAALGSMIRSAYDFVVPPIVKFAQDLWAGLNREVVTEVGSDGSTSQTMGNLVGEKIRDAFDYVVQFLKDFGTSVWKGLSGETVNAAAGDTNLATRLGTSFGNLLGKAIDVAVDVLKSLVAGWWNRVKSIWSDGQGGFLDNIWQTFVVTMPWFIGIGVASALPVIGPIVHMMYALAQGVWEVSKQFVQGAKSAWDYFTAVKDNGMTAFQETKESAKEFYDGVKGGIEDAKNMATVIRTNLSTAFSTLSTYITGTAWPAIKTFFTTLYTQGWTAISNFGTWITATALPAIRQFFVTLVTQTIPGVGRFILDMGVGAVKAVGSFVTSIFTTAIPAAYQFAVTFITQTIPATAKFLWQMGVGAVQSVGKFVLSIFTTAIPAAYQFAVTFITQTIPAVAKFIWNMAVGAVRGIGAFVASIFTTGIPAIVSFAVTFVTQTIPAVLGFIIGVGKGAVGAIGSMVKSIVMGGIPAMVSFGTSTWAAISPLLPIIGLFALGLAGIVTAAYVLVKAFQFLRRHWDDIKEAFTVGWAAVKYAFSTGWDYIKTIASNVGIAFDNMYEGLRFVFGSLMDIMAKPFHLLLSVAHTVLQKIVDFAASSPTISDMFGLTPDAVAAMKRNITSLHSAMATALPDKTAPAKFKSFEEVADSARTKQLRQELDAKTTAFSANVKARESARDAADALAASESQRATSGMPSGLMTALKPPPGAVDTSQITVPVEAEGTSVTDTLKGLITSVASGVKSGTETAVSAVKGLVTAAPDGVAQGEPSAPDMTGLAKMPKLVEAVPPPPDMPPTPKVGAPPPRPPPLVQAAAPTESALKMPTGVGGAGEGVGARGGPNVPSVTQPSMPGGVPGATVTPAGERAATQTSELQASTQTSVENLIKVTNRPEWVTEYFTKLDAQHLAVLAALEAVRTGKKAPAGTDVRYGPSGATRK